MPGVAVVHRVPPQRLDQWRHRERAGQDAHAGGRREPIGEPLGVVEGDSGDERVHLLDRPVTLLDLLRSGDLSAAGRDALRARPVALADVRLLAPLEPPTVRDFVAFEEHVEGVRKAVDGVSGVPDAWYDAPTFYFSNPYATLGPLDDVPVPPGSHVLDFELEVAAIIGREGRDLSPEQARDHIVGYTILNDWSARDLQSREMQVGLVSCTGSSLHNL